jgi:hypothetical protein
MKKQVLRIAVVVGTLLVASSAMAQGAPGDVLVNIPFPFLANNQLLPPGHYDVAPAANGVLRMVNMNDSNWQLFLNVHVVEKAVRQEPKLVFHRYGDSYFLAEVWNGRGSVGKQLFTSKREREMASGKIPGVRPAGEIAQVRPEP